MQLHVFLSIVTTCGIFLVLHVQSSLARMTAFALGLLTIALPHGRTPRTASEAIPQVKRRHANVCVDVFLLESA
eukprot:11163053-Lingulodinium_polyedra.AAC.1